MSASEILLGHILNEKKGFTVESAAETSFLLLECSMPHVLHFLLALLQDCWQQRWHLEETRECHS